MSCEYEAPGTRFAVQERDVHEQPAYSDEPFMEELTSLDLLDSVRAAPPDPTGVAVAVRIIMCHGIVVNTLLWVVVTIR